MNRPIVKKCAGAALAGMVLVFCIAAGTDGPAPKDGKEVYQHWCADCHNPGAGHPGTLRIAARSDPASAPLIRSAHDPDTIRYIVRNGMQMMPPFRQTEISDEELDRLAEYLAEPRP